jgi:plasmid stability protein
MVRTTMTLDDDVAEALRTLAHERHASFKQVVNETLRSGLKPAQATPATSYTTVSNMGVPKVDLTKALQLASDLEDQEIIRKLEQRR